MSKDGKRTYTGCTSDLQKRISQHNDGKIKSSKHFKPYEVLQVEKFDLLKDARTREKFFKSTTGRRRLKTIVEKWKNKGLNSDK